MTSTAYYPTIKWYYYNATGAAWVDISGYVLTKNGVSGHWGMRSNKYTDRLAATGEMRMLLDNADGVFDPDDAQCLTGWAINTKVKMVVTFDGVNYTRFYGKVDSIKLVNPTSYEFTAQVLVTDWMGYAYKKTLGEQSIETYKRGGELCAEIVTAVGQTPLATSYAVGDYEFPAAFDSMTTTTKAATELNKIVLSENGYFYNRHDKVNGETLVFEAESTRNGLRTVSKLPVLTADCGLWELEANTDLVLMEDGESFVTLDEVQDAHIDGTVQAYQRTHGENILNRVTVTAYPKRVDTAEQTIYSLGTAMQLLSGEIKTITVKYQNSSTKESCNAITDLCSQPVLTTDYLMNTKSTGTGTNITTSLVVDVTYYTSSATITLVNTSPYTGYVTRLYLKGYGVYQDSPAKTTKEDATSQSSYGLGELNIEQRYQRDIELGEEMANKILSAEKDPITRLNKVTMIANVAAVLLLAFLAVEVGDLVRITESSLNIDSDYYVNGVEFSVREGNVIEFSWILKQEPPEVEVTTTYTGVNIELASGANKIVWGSVPELENLTQKTIVFSTNISTLGGSGLTPILGFYRVKDTYPTGWGVDLDLSNDEVEFWETKTGGVNTGWSADITTGAHAIAISYDNSSTTNNPVIYLDGSSVAVSEKYGAPTYPSRNTADLPFIVGDYYLGGNSMTGTIGTIHIYNRILSAAEMEDVTDGTGGVTDGLVFSVIGIPQGSESSYYDQLLDYSMPVYDTVNDIMGIPVSAPICREIP